MLLFVDNIFRFTQAGSEVSALLGRIPSAVGYQPTLVDRDGRAAGAHHLDQQGLDHLGAGDLRARRRPDRPGAGDGVRPPRRDDRALARASPRSASTRPSIRSTRRRRSSSPAGRRRGALRQSRARCSASCSATRSCRTSSPSSAWTSSRKTTSCSSARARKIQRFLSQPFYVAETFTGAAGQVRRAQGHHPRLQGDRRRQVRRPARAGVLHGRHASRKRSPRASSLIKEAA